jgi:hypothetical protein
MSSPKEFSWPYNGKVYDYFMDLRIKKCLQAIEEKMRKMAQLNNKVGKKFCLCNEFIFNKLH